MAEQQQSSEPKAPVGFEQVVTCRWITAQRRWVFEINDGDGKMEISPIRRNALLKSLRFELRKLYRRYRVRTWKGHGVPVLTPAEPAKTSK